MRRAGMVNRRGCGIVNGPILWTVDFGALVAGTLTAGQLAAIDSALVFSRASSGATFRTDASTLSATTAGIDEARIANLGSSKIGLLIEESRANHAKDSRYTSGVGWSTGPTTPDAIAGPDGAVSADRCTVVGTAILTQSTTTLAAAIGSKATFSHWCRAVSGTQTHQVLFYDQVPLTATFASIGTTWQRLSLTRTIQAGATNHTVVTCEGRDRSTVGGTTSHSEDVYLDMHQIEAGAFPSSYIDNTGSGSTTRSAERLRHTNPAAMLDGGRLGLHLTLYPSGASNEYTGTPYLWACGSDYARWDATTRVVTVSIGGVVRTLGALPTWSREDQLDVFVAAGGGSRSTVGSAWVNGGAATDLGSAAAQAAISPAANPIDFVQNANASHFTGVVRKQTVYRAGTKPAQAVAA